MIPPAPTPLARWRLGPRIFATRPKLMIALATGVAVAVACFLLAPDLRASSSGIFGWDAFCGLYLVLMLRAFAGRKPDEIRARAAKEDQGQAIILALIVAACAASIAAVAIDLAMAHGEYGLAKALDITVAFATVTASWLMMQMVFALHYAHEYYARDPKTKKDRGGLAFPGGDEPDYWDFVHFTIVIGVAAQTADIAFTDRRLRRLGTLHSLIAFAFNTLIVALTINLVAGLF